MRMKMKTYKTKEKAAADLGITVNQLDAIGHAAYGVYQEIGADLAEVNGGRGMSRNMVMEVVLDAGRTEEFLHRRSADYKRWEQKPEAIADIDAAVAAMQSRQFSYEQLLGAMKLYFTYSRYE